MTDQLSQNEKTRNLEADKSLEAHKKEMEELEKTQEEKISKLQLVYDKRMQQLQNQFVEVNNEKTVLEEKLKTMDKPADPKHDEEGDNDGEELAEVERQKNKELQRALDDLIMKNADGVKDLRKANAQIETLTKKYKEEILKKDGELGEKKQELVK